MNTKRTILTATAPGTSSGGGIASVRARETERLTGRDRSAA